MPEQTGLDWLADQRRIGLFADTILITAYADLETAIRALRAGVTDFVLKPFRSNQMLNVAVRALDRKRLRRENYLLRHALNEGDAAGRGRLLGNSAAIAEVREMLARVAPLPTPVLFTGESGTGKEIAARTLHGLSDRADRPFVAINCAAVPAEHLADELFGAVEGKAYRKDGLFLHADGGRCSWTRWRSCRRRCRRGCCACSRISASARAGPSAKSRSTCGSFSPPTPT